jgi:2,3-bisphosphoglycerate-independent phosphoglycerate mutase
VISAVDLIQGIGRCAGMDVIKVEGATGTYETKLLRKGACGDWRAFGWADYVYIHVEAPDECGHHARDQGKGLFH